LSCGPGRRLAGLPTGKQLLDAGVGHSGVSS
jgi:hypothetical protein